MISFKDDTINPSSMTPQLLLAIMVADQVYGTYDTDVVITSLNDANHSETSLHYAGNAVDIRTWTLPDDVSASMVADEIKDKLNKHYDVIFESDHIHIEYQPRRSGHVLL